MKTTALRRTFIAAALAAAPAPLAGQSNPVSASVRDAAQYNAKNLVAAAQALPAAEYGFKPTPAQWSFAQVVLHVADDNRITCAAIAGKTPEAAVKLAPTDAKEKLVEALQRSLAICDSAVAGLTDAKLGDTVTYYGQNATRASAALGLVMDWSDHYAQLAIYLRLNGVLSPTAKNGGM